MSSHISGIASLHIIAVHCMSRQGILAWCRDQVDPIESERERQVEGIQYRPTSIHGGQYVNEALQIKYRADRTP